jgi:hypothetical protein
LSAQALFRWSARADNGAYPPNAATAVARLARIVHGYHSAAETAAAQTWFSCATIADEAADDAFGSGISQQGNRH